MADGEFIGERDLYLKAYEVVRILDGVSISQAEVILNDAGAMLKQSIWINTSDVDEVKRQFVLPFVKED